MNQGRLRIQAMSKKVEDSELQTLTLSPTNTNDDECCPFVNPASDETSFPITPPLSYSTVTTTSSLPAGEKKKIERMVSYPGSSTTKTVPALRVSTPPGNTRITYTNERPSEKKFDLSKISRDRPTAGSSMGQKREASSSPSDLSLPLPGRVTPMGLGNVGYHKSKSDLNSEDFDTDSSISLITFPGHQPPSWQNIDSVKVQSTDTEHTKPNACYTEAGHTKPFTSHTEAGYIKPVPSCAESGCLKPTPSCTEAGQVKPVSGLAEVEPVKPIQRNTGAEHNKPTASYSEAEHVKLRPGGTEVGYIKPIPSYIEAKQSKPISSFTEAGQINFSPSYTEAGSKNPIVSCTGGHTKPIPSYTEIGRFKSGSSNAPASAGVAKPTPSDLGFSFPPPPPSRGAAPLSGRGGRGSLGVRGWPGGRSISRLGLKQRGGVDARRVDRPLQHHTFLADVADVRQIEQGLLQLMEDFQTGSLRAFGKDSRLRQMEAIREQQERLARLHFDVGAEQDLYPPLSEEGLRNSTDNMRTLMEKLAQLSESIERLHTNTSNDRKSSSGERKPPSCQSSSLRSNDGASSSSGGGHSKYYSGGWTSNVTDGHTTSNPHHSHHANEALNHSSGGHGVNNSALHSSPGTTASPRATPGQHQSVSRLRNSASNQLGGSAKGGKLPDT